MKPVSGKIVPMPGRSPPITTITSGVRTVIRIIVVVCCTGCPTTIGGTSVATPLAIPRSATNEAITHNFYLIILELRYRKKGYNTL